MNHADLIQYAPLVLAGYEMVCTLLFVGYASRPTVSASTFGRAHMLWWMLSFAAGVGFIFWVVYSSLRLGGVPVRMLILLFLGMAFPILGAFGLVAWAQPALWERFISARDASREHAQQKDRERLGRAGERLRRFMGGPPPPA